MKLRQGFVSNSSSTSFCIIGVAGWRNNDLPKQLFRAEKLDEIYNIEDHDDPHKDYFSGSADGKFLNFYGSEEGPSYAGIDAQKLLETMTIPQAKGHVRLLMQDKLGIEVPINKIEFIYGEVSTG